MKEKNTWMTPGPPWELHVLSLVFILVAAAVPVYANYLASPFPSRTLLEEALHPNAARLPACMHMRDLVWAAVLLFLGAVTLVLSRFRADRNSTPLPAFIAPIFFAFVGYYRLYASSRGDGSVAAIVTSSPMQLLLWVAATLIIVILVARIRIARYALRFRDTKWDLASSAQHDKTSITLALRVLPLIYEPRTYRACDRGVLIEGWFYMLVVPFDLVHAVSEASRPDNIYAGEYFATSLNELVRFQIAGQSLPVYISPQQHAEFLSYCQQRVRRIHRQTTQRGATPSPEKTEAEFATTDKHG